MADFEIGKFTDTKKRVEVPSSIFTKHFISLGASGSGKTVLCKAVLEEAALNGIPSIIIDSQGDLASLYLNEDEEALSKAGLSVLKQQELRKKSVVNVFTPTSSKGIPISVNPLVSPPKNIGYEEVVGIFQMVSEALVKILGYNIEKDDGKSVQAFLYKILYFSWKQNRSIKTLDKLMKEVKSTEGSLTSKEKQTLVKKLDYLFVGENELLFNFGDNIDISRMVAKDSGKAKQNVFYINSINSEEQREFFLTVLLSSLYQWMLSNPKKDLQFLVYIDEAARFIPSGSRKPMTKPIISMLLKQGRKYGVGVMLSTQNPGDIDYTAFAQISSWAIGRLTTKQDIAKVKDALKSTSAPDTDKIISLLPSVKPSEFVLFSPDYMDDIDLIRTRWLYSKHKTLSPEDISKQFPKMHKPKGLTHADAKEELKGSVSHLPLEVEDEQLQRIIASNRKKKFGLFGNFKDDLESISLKMMPYYSFNIEYTQKKFIGSGESRLGTILVDATDGSLAKIEKNAIKTVCDCSSLIGMAKNEILLVMKMQGLPSFSISKAEERIKLSKLTVRSIIRKLEKKELIRSEIINKKESVYHITKDYSVLSDIVRLLSEPFVEDDSRIEAQVIKPKVDVRQAESFLKDAFAEIKEIDSSELYVPVYEVVLDTKGTKRILRINGLDSSIMD